MVFLDKRGLGMRVPSKDFSVSDVKACVGSKRIVDVMDVTTQKALTMSMKEWCDYYEEIETDDSEKKRADNRLLNVISLEFSHTKLESHVEAPLVVRQLDWIDTAWPRHLREAHTESTNIMEEMKYPKVVHFNTAVMFDFNLIRIELIGSKVRAHECEGLLHRLSHRHGRH